MVKDSEGKYISELVAGCLEGEKAAWTELIQRITPLVFSICGRMKLSREDSYDVHGQVSYLLWKNLSSLKSSEKLLAYVTTITRRVVFALQQKAKLLKRVEEAMEEEMIFPDPERPDDLYEETERREALMRAIAQLPPKEYKLMQALFFEAGNPSYEEIGQRLGIPASSIGPSRMRCFKKLYRILKRHELFFKYFS